MFSVQNIFLLKMFSVLNNFMCFATYYYLKNIVALDNGGMQMRQQYIEEIPCPAIDSIVDDESIFKYFRLSQDEIDFIKDYIAKRKYEIANNNDNEPDDDE